MLTILHTESSKGWGGQESRTIHECVGLKRLGARPIVLSRPGSTIARRAAQAGIEVRTFEMRGSYDLRALIHVLGLIKREKVDVVSTHSGVDSFICALAGRFSRRRPVVVRTRHLALPITSKSTYSLLPHRVVTVSGYVRSYLVDKVGLRADRVVAVPTGIDLERFDPEKTPDTLRRELGVGSDVPLVGTVAILRRKKGHHVLLDAIPKILQVFPKALFIFAGDGPQKTNITTRIKELGIGSNVKLLGLRTDVPGILKGIDLFVLPTLEEALGTSYLEAMAMKKAVVGTSVGGVPEVVKDGVNGLLVPPEDPDALAEAVIKLLNDRELAERMGTAGRAMVEKDFSTQIMARRMFDLYNELVEKRRSGA